MYEVKHDFNGPAIEPNIAIRRLHNIKFELERFSLQGTKYIGQMRKSSNYRCLNYRGFLVTDC